MSIEMLPDDMLIEICSFLPLKYILSFRVSNFEYNSHLSSPKTGSLFVIL